MDWRQLNARTKPTGTLMVIIIRGNGNHSNRLFQAIHIEAYCIENNVPCLNPSFHDMSKYYGIKSRSVYTYAGSLIRILSRLNLVDGEEFTASEKNELYGDMMKQKKKLFAAGWSFRVNGLTAKYRDYFIDKYSLLPKYYDQNSLCKMLLELDREAYTVVGIHVRRGDYKEWENGRYFFPDTVYLKYMKSLLSELQKVSEKKILFIVCSNDDTAIGAEDNIIISKNPWYIDQFIMSKCDYLLGPPSTFTMWASYIGRVKYFHMYSGTGALTLSDFIMCEG